MTNYFTPKGLKKIQEEYNQLLLVERPNVTKTVAWAAGNGDRSENADYIYGKKRLREIDSRLRFLQKRLEDVVVIDPISVKSSTVQFGATVTVINSDGKEKKYSIVGADEIDTSKNYISFKSPIGSALLNKKVGDFVEIVIPKGSIELEILKIEYIEL